MKSIWKRASSALLIIIILIVIIPSWRVRFQAWYQSWFLDEVVFVNQSSSALNEDVLQWQLFNQSDELKVFSDFAGEPVILNFWATWCPSCRAELPELSELSQNVDEKINCIAVTTETPETVTKTGLSQKYDFIYYTQDYPSSLKISVFPTLMILDSDLRLIYRQNGAASISNEKNIAFLNALRKDSN